MKTRYSAGLPVLGLSILLSTVPFSQGQLGISPLMIETRAYPGSMKTFTINVSSASKTPLTCTVSVNGLKVTDSGAPSAVDDAVRSCSKWLSISPESFRLKPGEGKEIICRLRVPKGKGGGYYALISSHSVPEVGDDDGNEGAKLRSAVRFSYRNLIPILLTVPAPDAKAVIQAAAPSISRSGTGAGYLLQLPVRNQGSLHARIRGTANIRSKNGALIDSYELAAGRGFILPGCTRVFSTHSNINLPDGAFVTDLRLDVVGYNSPMRRQFPFTVQEGRAAFGVLSAEEQAALNQRSAGFAVSVPYMVAPLRPGARTVQAIELRNLTNEAIPLSVRILHWDRRSDGLDLVPDKSPSHGRAGVELVSLRQVTSVLRPMSRQRIPIQISLPKTASGEYYAAVVFDRSDHKLPDSPTDRVRRSALLTVQVQGENQSLAGISSLTANRLPSGIVEIKAMLRNRGNVSVNPEISFTLTDATGDQMGKLTPSPQPPAILGGGEAVVPMSWERILPAGEYAVVAALRFSPQIPAVTARTSFTVPETTAATAAATITNQQANQPK